MRKTQRGAAVVSSTALLTAMVGSGSAWAATTSQASVCQTYQKDLVAFDAAVNADSAVKAADAAYFAAHTALVKAVKADTATRTALVKAKKAKKSAAVIAKAYKAYVKAHNAKIAATKNLAATKARADYVRAVTWQQLRSVVDAACLAPPSSLAANVSNGDVLLTWQGPTDVAGYRVYRNGVLVATVTSQTFSFDDSNVKNGTTYNYMVRSFVFDAESQDSNIVQAMPVLPAPTGLNASPGDARVALSWNGVAGATSYQVYRNGTQITTRTSTSYTDTGLTDGTTYTYTVRAVSNDMVSGDSNVVTSTPVASAPPAAPTNVVATGGIAQIVINWTASSGATSYKILRGGTQVGTSTSTTYTDTTVTPGTSYTYTVQAVNAAGSSSSSGSSSATATPAVAPSAPTNVVATGGANQVALTWTAPSGATGYTILRSGTQIGTSTTASYTDTTAVPGTTYSYTVVATAGSLSSSPSSAATGMAVPAAPSGFTATAGDTVANLSWTAVSGATSYIVLRGGTQIATPTGTTYQDTALTNGQTYTYTVRAVEGPAVSADSASQSATPGVPVPLTAPTGLSANSATNLNTGALQITWTAVTGATGYTIYQDGTQVGTSTTASYTPTVSAYNATHSYTVMATNGTPSLNSPLSAATVAGVYQGTAANDANGRTLYGQIQDYIVVTVGTTKSITGCWATYPTNSDSGTINPKAIPKLCSQVLSVQPTSANATTAITNVSGASFTSPAFKTSLASALTLAGM